MDFEIIDCHLHCGVQKRPWAGNTSGPCLRPRVSGGSASSRRWRTSTTGSTRTSPTARPGRPAGRRAHRYLLELREACRSGAAGRFDLYPYFFVWNDFAWEDLGPEYVAIKWHRHPDEPRYHYDHPRCREFLQMVRQRRLPILLEESFENTLFFLNELAPDLPVVIPHLGGLNGGYGPLKAAGVWNRPQTYTDSSTAALAEIEDFLGRYGSDRLLFGSDHPFGEPQLELAKILDLKLPADQARASWAIIFGGSMGCRQLNKKRAG